MARLHPSCPSCTCPIPERVLPKQAPEQWGMFTKKGNGRITRGARRFLSLVRASAGTEAELVEHATTFLKGWQHMRRFHTFQESTDTAVREAVYEFVVQVVGDDMADLAWEEAGCG